MKELIEKLPDDIPREFVESLSEVSQSSSKARFGTGKVLTLLYRVEAEGQLFLAFEFLAFCNGGFVMKREEALEKVDGALAELEQALANGDSETLKAYLAFLGRFHNYSFGNLILIFMQCPHASHVAGFNAWKKHK